jgi:hypothetical protein
MSPVRQPIIQKGTGRGNKFQIGEGEDGRRRSTSVADDSVLEEVNVRHVRSPIRGKQPRSSLWIREPRSGELDSESLGARL